MKLFDLMEKKGMTAYRLSKETGIPRSTFTRLKSGQRKLENLTFVNLKKIADALGVRVDDLQDDPE